MRGTTYNPQLGQIEKLTAVTKKIAAAHGVSPAQPVAWAVAKGTAPILGVTSPEQVADAVKAASIVLTAEERRSWNRRQCRPALTLAAPGKSP